MSKQLIKGAASTIQSIRKSKGLSQEELAYKASLDRTYISGVERGIRNITLNSLESIINALEISLATFLSELTSNLELTKKGNQ